MVTMSITGKLGREELSSVVSVLLRSSLEPGGKSNKADVGPRLSLEALVTGTSYKSWSSFSPSTSLKGNNKKNFNTKTHYIWACTNLYNN